MQVTKTVGEKRNVVTLWMAELVNALVTVLKNVASGESSHPCVRFIG